MDTEFSVSFSIGDNVRHMDNAIETPATAQANTSNAALKIRSFKICCSVSLAFTLIYASNV